MQKGIFAGFRDVVPPSAFTLSAPSSGSSSINLSWTAATDNYGVTGYDVYITGAFFASTGNLFYTASGLIPATSYSIFVKAKDAANNTRNSNTVNVITDPSGSSGFGTLVLSTGYNTEVDLTNPPFGNGQLGNGLISRTIFHEGTGSFRSRPANASSGIRSEVQYDESQTPVESVIEYYVRYAYVVQNNCHSVQWHPNTGGGGAVVALWHVDGQFNATLWKAGINYFQTAGQPGALMDIPLNQWLYMRWHVKFHNTAGYIHFYIDDVLYFDRTNNFVGDGSGQYFKLGFNGGFDAADQSNDSDPAVIEAKKSDIYYDELKIWQV